MRYLVRLGDQERELDVRISPTGGVSISMDGKPVEAEVTEVPGGLLLRIDGRIYDIALGSSGDTELQVAAGAVRVVAEVESERERAKRARKGGGGSSSKEVRAPMPGRIVKILVAVGDSVSKGDPVIVIEAMKMENELRAGADGVIAGIDVSEGQNVENKTLLVRFE